ncbi:aldehyde dehydrogenase family protein, partial [Halomonas sp. TRM85114]|uniref:aldehyde dehydrogenase family protein n=1 Tax=Halomonas jincaotanensis TaxID=2810616 RepID=UPI001BD5C0CE
MNQIQHFLNGQVVEGASGRTFPVYNPATGEQKAEVALASADETREAVRIAHDAFATWSTFTPLKRSRILFKFKALVEEHADELARLISQEHGKVFSDAKGEVTRGLEVVEFACG